MPPLFSGVQLPVVGVAIGGVSQHPGLHAPFMRLFGHVLGRNIRSLEIFDNSMQQRPDLLELVRRWLIRWAADVEKLQQQFKATTGHNGADVFIPEWPL
ncbi:hypothetical protein EMCRGX_G005496 [Ephydatia muelleri]